MFINKTVTMIVALLILLAAVPVWALEGSAEFILSETMVCAGTEFKAGSYDVKYQSSSPEVTVTFMLKGKVIAKIQGKIEELNKKNESSSMLIGKDASGRPVINSLQFGGKKIRVNF
jgi:hypothetical protein